MANYSVPITRLFVSHHSQNAWAFLQGVGWRKIGTQATDGTTNVFVALVAARTRNITPSISTNAADDRIELAYV
jgi:hypothetical protein